MSNTYSYAHEQQSTILNSRGADFGLLRQQWTRPGANGGGLAEPSWPHTAVGGVVFIPITNTSSSLQFDSHGLQHKRCRTLSTHRRRGSCWFRWLCCSSSSSSSSRQTGVVADNEEDLFAPVLSRRRACLGRPLKVAEHRASRRETLTAKHTRGGWYLSCFPIKLIHLGAVGRHCPSPLTPDTSPVLARYDVKTTCARACGREWRYAVIVIPEYRTRTVVPRASTPVAEAVACCVVRRMILRSSVIAPHSTDPPQVGFHS